MSGRKADTTSDPGHIIYLRSSHVVLVLLLLWAVSSGKYVEESHLHCEDVPSKVSTQCLPSLPPHSQAEGCENAKMDSLLCSFFHRTFRNSGLLHGLGKMKRPLSPVLCHKRVKNNNLLGGDHTVRFFFLFSCALSSHRHP